MAWRLRHGSRVRRSGERDVECIVSLCREELGRSPSSLTVETLVDLGCESKRDDVLRYLDEQFVWDSGGHSSSCWWAQQFMLVGATVHASRPQFID